MTTATTTQPPREASGFEYYGRAVWPWGDDGEDGVMIEGHGRRALAALKAWGREMDGRYWLPQLAYSATERWVIVHLDCGCLAEDHAAKHLDEGCDCPRGGLPPCETDRFAWTIEHVTEGTPGAVALTEVLW